MRWHGDWMDPMYRMPGTVNGDRPSLTRQEFAADANVNTFLARYGFPQGRPSADSVTEVDYDIRRSEAFWLARDARRSFQRLPKPIRDAYPTWEALFAAAARGEVVVAHGGPVVVPKAPADGPVPVPD